MLWAGPLEVNALAALDQAATPAVVVKLHTLALGLLGDFEVSEVGVEEVTRKSIFGGSALTFTGRLLWFQGLANAFSYSLADHVRFSVDHCLDALESLGHP